MLFIWLLAACSALAFAPSAWAQDGLLAPAAVPAVAAPAEVAAPVAPVAAAPAEPVAQAAAVGSAAPRGRPPEPQVGR